LQKCSHVKNILREYKMDKEEIKRKGMAMKDWLVDIRRDLHMHPELGLEETRTSEVIKKHLDQMGIEYVAYEGQTSVVGIIHGGFPGKTVAIRADMDALPLSEINDVTYKSKTDGVMHACGHDAHVAILIGAARLLNGMKDELYGNVKLLFQPAEESVGGADTMVKAGCMKNPDVDYVIGLHVMPHLNCGLIETKYGDLNAATDDITITIQGKSAHGAYPELGTDAIAIAGQVITALQTVTSRSVSPLDSVVLSIGKITGGTRANIIADKVKMEATLRTFNPSTRALVKKKITDIVEGVSQGLGGKGIVGIEPGYEALINSEEVVDVIISTAKEILGEENLVIREKPSLGAEDFSYFIDASKGAFYHIGCSRKDDKMKYPLHSCQFNLDENCLPIGAIMHASIVLNLLK
jgi:amidohydrolase